MIHPKLAYRQQGVALIISLLLLFILTLVAVSSFTSSHVQERAASNNRLQTMAFEAAAAGANNAIDFFMNNVEADAPDTLCGRKDHLGWDDPTPWRTVAYDVDDVRLSQRMYCLNDEYPCGPGEVGCVTGARPPRSQLFVASRGEVLDPSGTQVMAVREIEVRITRRNDTYLVEGCGAICFPACEAQVGGRRGDEVLIDFPSSNVFTVDGDGGPAVTTGLDCPDSSLLDAILADLKSSRLGNYDGGLHQQDPGQPWNDPNMTDRFRAQILAQAVADPNDDNLLIGPGYPGFVEGVGEHGGVYTDMGNTEYGTYPGNPTITYIQGDLEMGGNISGAGIMMVEGNIAWNGTPDYKGLIISLGGTYTIDGGGTGGNHAGSVVVLNNNNETGCGADNSCSDFGAISWQNTGGGTAEYNWDCDALTMAFEMVYNTAEDTDPLWGFDCERGPPTLFETPADLVIASWRENIGWREEFFAAE